MISVVGGMSVFLTVFFGEMQCVHCQMHANSSAETIMEMREELILAFQYLEHPATFNLIFS